MQCIWTIFTSHSSSKSLPLLIFCTLKKNYAVPVVLFKYPRLGGHPLGLGGPTRDHTHKNMDSPFSRSHQLSITLQLGWSSWVTTPSLLEYWFDLVLVSRSPRELGIQWLCHVHQIVSLQCILPLAFAVSPPLLLWDMSYLEMSTRQSLISCILISCVSPYQLPSTAQRSFSNWNGGWTKKWV